MAPSWGLIPLVVLATIATVIATRRSSPAPFPWRGRRFSSPAAPLRRPAHLCQDAGQIYMPRINWILLVGVLALVGFFRARARWPRLRHRLTGSMLIDSILLLIVAWVSGLEPLYRGARGAAAGGDRRLVPRRQPAEVLHAAGRRC